MLILASRFVYVSSKKKEMKNANVEQRKTPRKRRKNKINDVCVLICLQKE